MEFPADQETLTQIVTKTNHICLVLTQLIQHVDNMGDVVNQLSTTVSNLTQQLAELTKPVPAKSTPQPKILSSSSTNLSPSFTR